MEDFIRVTKKLSRDMTKNMTKNLNSLGFYVFFFLMFSSLNNFTARWAEGPCMAFKTAQIYMLSQLQNHKGPWYTDYTHLQNHRGPQYID